MKNNLLTISLIAVLLLSAVLVPKAYAQQYVWHPLSSNGAVQTVQVFEANPNLAVTVNSSPSMNSSSPGTATIYSLISGRYNYSVCAYAATSFFRGDNLFYSNKDQFYGQPYDASSLSQQEMSQSAAQTIAQAFMQSHFPAPQLLTTMRISSNLATKGDPSEPDFIETYSFQFIQNCGNNVEGPSRCEIDVDTIKGQIVAYSADYFPVLISSTPALSQNQAMASAMNMMQIQNGQPDTVDSISISFPDAFGNEQFLYGMTFSGTGVAPGSTLPYDETGIFYAPPLGNTTYLHSSENYTAVVDGNIGNIVAWSTTLSGGKPGRINLLYGRKIKAFRHSMLFSHSLAKRLNFHWVGKPISLSYPLIDVDKHPYAFVGYLCYGSPEAKLSMKTGKRIVVSGPDRQVNLHLNSLTYQINGQTKQMSSKPVLVNGRCYVPLDVMQTVLGGKWRYDAKAQTVYYDPPQVKQAHR